MANKKISELDSRASLSLSDLLAVGDPTTGYLYKITITDLKTLTGAGVISFNGRVGSVTPAEGDYTLNQLGDVIITTATNNDVLRYNGSNWVNAQIFTGTIAQYVDGTGAYQTFPTLLSSDRLITEVRNTTGATVTKGTVIYLSGSSGTLPLIAKAQANSEATSSSTYGVVQNDIANNANGYVVVIGNLTGINTSAYNAGDVLWLSPTVAGGVTTTKPSAPNNSVYIGIVTRSNSTQGTIEVKVQNGYELDELHNVSISSVANNEVLVYESATTLWKNKTIPTILGYTPANAATYVPYTGATADLNTGAYYIYTNSLVVTNGGSGFLAALTADILNGIGILNLTSGGKNGNLKPTTLGADRTWTLPDASGTIALTSNLSSYVPTSRTITINGTAYDLSADRSWTISSSQWTTSGGDIYFNGGNVGINTASPTSRLTVGRVDSSYEGGQIDLCRASDNANAWGIDVWGNSSTPSFRIIDNVAATTRFTIDGSGNVGIANSTPSYKLDVTGTGRFTGTLIAGAANGNIRLSGATTDGFIGVNTSTMYLTDWATAAIGMTINLSTGAATISSTVATTGVVFPSSQVASANANTLDDYEEGTFTPTLGGNSTYSTQYGNYTKIGNKVYFKIMLTIVTIGTGNAQTISGLPFTCDNTAIGYPIFVGAFQGLSVARVFMGGRVNGNSTDVAMRTLGAAAVGVAAQNIFTDGTTIEISGYYGV